MVLGAEVAALARALVWTHASVHVRMLAQVVAQPGKQDSGSPSNSGLGVLGRHTKRL